MHPAQHHWQLILAPWNSSEYVGSGQKNKNQRGKEIVLCLGEMLCIVSLVLCSYRTAVQLSSLPFLVLLLLSTAFFLIFFFPYVFPSF